MPLVDYSGMLFASGYIFFPLNFFFFFAWLFIVFPMCVDNEYI